MEIMYKGYCQNKILANFMPANLIKGQILFMQAMLEGNLLKIL